jgi:hypothetical protein
MSAFSRSSNPASLLVLWIITSMAAWSVGALALSVQSIRTTAEIAYHAGQVALVGLLAGLILGGGQSTLLRTSLPSWRRHLLATSLGVLLGLSLGFLADIGLTIIVALRSGIGRLGDGGTFFMPSPPMMLLIAGLVVGLLQLRPMETLVGGSTTRAALWVLSTMACLAGGWFVAQIVGSNLGIGEAGTGLVFGFLYGLGSGTLLVLLMGSPRMEATTA